MSDKIKESIVKEKPIFKSKKVVSYLLTVLIFCAITYYDTNWSIICAKGGFLFVMFVVYIYGKTKKDLAFLANIADKLIEDGTTSK